MSVGGLDGQGTRTVQAQVRLGIQGCVGLVFTLCKRIGCAIGQHIAAAVSQSDKNLVTAFDIDCRAVFVVDDNVVEDQLDLDIIGNRHAHLAVCSLAFDHVDALSRDAHRLRVGRRTLPVNDGKAAVCRRTKRYLGGRGLIVGSVLLSLGVFKVHVVNIRVTRASGQCHNRGVRRCLGFFARAGRKSAKGQAQGHSARKGSGPASGATQRGKAHLRHGDQLLTYSRISTFDATAIPSAWACGRAKSSNCH